MNATDRSIYLGDPSSDPPPVWREDAPDAFKWPEGAVFAVVFVRPDPVTFWWNSHYGDVASFTEFFGEDGWPVAFPADKRDLAERLRRELQAAIHDWRGWEQHEWESVRNHPHLCGRFRKLKHVLTGLAEHTSALANAATR